MHGRLAQFLVLVVMAGFLYGALWSVIGKDALPGGNLFSITILWVGCAVSGWLIGKIHLPPLLGGYALEVFVNITELG